MMRRPQSLPPSLQVSACSSTIQHHLDSKGSFVVAADLLQDATYHKQLAAECMDRQAALLQQLMKLGPDHNPPSAESSDGGSRGSCDGRHVSAV